jgi:hypothetical protein
LTRSRFYILAGVVVGIAIWVAVFGVKTRYSCGEGWDVSVTSRSEAVSYCTAGDVPQNPTIFVDNNVDLRVIVLALGLIVASVPMRLASKPHRSADRSPAHISGSSG